MASTYTISLGLEKPTDGEKSGLWGALVNAQFEFLEEAIAGVVSVAMSDADQTLSATQGASNQARHMVLKFTGSQTQARTVTVPGVEKVYILHNATSGGFDVNVKTSSGTAFPTPAGKVCFVYCDGTSITAINHIPNPAFGAASATSLTLSGPVDSATKAATKAYVDGLADDVRIAFSSHGLALGASAIVASFVCADALTLPASLTGSYGRAVVAATGSATFTILKNGSSIGSVQWAGAATSATFTFSTQQDLVAGDVLTIRAPATADATLAGLSITLVATRTI